MGRAHVSVRDARAEDLPDLLVLWAELRDLTARADRAVPAPTEAEILGRLGEVERDPAARIVVAVRDERVIAMAVLVAAPLAPLVDSLAVHIHYLQVRAGQRRKGAGRALMAAAAAYADECAAEHVVASVPPSLRDANRFYAGLGLAPLVVRRAAAVPALRRRLSVDGAKAGVDDVVARRRSLRGRARLSQALAHAGE